MPHLKRQVTRDLMIAADPIHMDLGLKHTKVFISIHNDNCT